MADIIQQNVLILGKEYTIACAPEERQALHESARLLDLRMREIKDSGKVIGSERVAVMAALNIAHELFDERNRDDGDHQRLKERLRALQEKIDGVLAQEDRQMEL